MSYQFQYALPSIIIFTSNRPENFSGATPKAFLKLRENGMDYQTLILFTSLTKVSDFRRRSCMPHLQSHQKDIG